MNRKKRSVAEASDRSLNVEPETVDLAKTKILQVNRRPILFLVSLILFGVWLVYLVFMCLRVLLP